jgi:hypothetical protein
LLSGMVPADSRIYYWLVKPFMFICSSSIPHKQPWTTFVKGSVCLIRKIFNFSIS